MKSEIRFFFVVFDVSGTYAESLLEKPCKTKPRKRKIESFHHDLLLVKIIAFLNLQILRAHFFTAPHLPRFHIRRFPASN